jgi:hypothetical protein
MTASQLVKKIKKVEVSKKIGKKSVVVLPIAVWREIEDFLEDLEMSQSRKFAATIKKARSQKNFISREEIKEIFGI